MKKILIISVFIFLVINIFSQNTWRIDNANSNVTFAIDWMQNSHRTGEFKIFEGDIIIPTDNTFDNAKVDFSIEASSIDLIASNLISTVQGEEYLDTKNYPKILFQSTSIKKKHKKNYEVKGKLTIKDITRDVDFELEDNGIIEYEGRQYGAVTVTGKLKRSDFKIYGGGDRLGDNINITAYFQITKIIVQ